MKPFHQMKPEEFKAITNGNCKGSTDEGVDTYLYLHIKLGKRYCTLEADFERMRGELRECDRSLCPIDAYEIVGHTKLTDHFNIPKKEKKEEKVQENDCFSYRFTTEGVRMGFCKIMIRKGKQSGVLAVDYVSEEQCKECKIKNE